MLTSFLLVITSFWILKPLRKALFVQHYDHVGLTLGTLQLGAAQAELCAKLLQVALATLLALAFGRLAKRYRRRGMLTAIAGFFALAFMALAVSADHPSTPFIWVLYSAGDLYSTLMVAALFACLNDLATPDSARRSYGIVGLGAVLGGVLGSQIVSVFLGALSLRAWLFVCSALTVLAGACALQAGARAAAAPAAQPLQPSAASSSSAVSPARSLPPYLLSLALIVGLYEIISTLLDYQFTATLARELDGAAIGRQMGRAFALMNATALCVQLFLTTPLLRRYGSQVALLLLPCTLLCASLGMLVVPSLAMASLVPALDSGFSYSVHQSAKEGLYVPLSRDTKYGAKAFIDVFVLRCAKAIGLLLCFAFAAFGGEATSNTSMTRLSLFTLALVVPFALAAMYAGKRSNTLHASGVAVRRAVLP